MIYAIQRMDSQWFLRGYGNAPDAVEWCPYPGDALNLDWASAFAVARILRRAFDIEVEAVPVGVPIPFDEDETPFSDLTQYHRPDGLGWDCGD